MVAIESVCSATPWSEGVFLEEVNKESARFFVAEVEKVGVGFGVYWVVAGEAQLANIAVAPLWQGRGVGTKILNHLLIEAWRENAEKMTLEVRAGNLVARGLYRKAGFVETSQRLKFYEGKENAVLLEKSLVLKGGLDHLGEDLKAESLKRMEFDLDA